MIKAITSEHAPAAIGPYSQAVVSGDLVFCSGQIPLDRTTGQLVPGDADAQTAQVLANLQGVLAVEGLGLENVVKTTVFLTDLADFEAVNHVYEVIFLNTGSPVLPARSTVQVAALPRGARVEIEAIAVRPTD